MHLKGMSHWLWTWRVWEKVKYGLMVRALEDIGLHTPMVTAMAAVIPEPLNPISASLVVASQLRDGNFTK